MDVIHLCAVLLCFEDASEPVGEGYSFCPKHAGWYREYVAAGRPRNVRRWLTQAHPEARLEVGWLRTRDGE
jgi:hypothetical protein